MTPPLLSKVHGYFIPFSLAFSSRSRTFVIRVFGHVIFDTYLHSDSFFLPSESFGAWNSIFWRPGSALSSHHGRTTPTLYREGLRRRRSYRVEAGPRLVRNPRFLLIFQQPSPELTFGSVVSYELPFSRQDSFSCKAGIDPPPLSFRQGSLKGDNAAQKPA